MPPTQITAASIWTARPKTMTHSLDYWRLDPAPVFRRGFDQPLPHRLGVGAGDVEIEGRSVVDRMEERADMAEQTLCAGPGGKSPRMEIDRAALGEEVAAARPDEAQRRTALAEIGDCRRCPGKGDPDQRVEIAVAELRLDD